MFDHEGGSKMNIRRHPNWNNEGVASTVGTIMALMVFLAFLSMFTSQYVPVWMEENEASHMNVVYSQFANLKQSVAVLIKDIVKEFKMINAVYLLVVSNFRNHPFG